jgi:hypothetical protein
MMVMCVPACACVRACVCLQGVMCVCGFVWVCALMRCDATTRAGVHAQLLPLVEHPGHDSEAFPGLFTVALPSYCWNPVRGRRG